MATKATTRCVCSHTLLEYNFKSPSTWFSAKGLTFLAAYYVSDRLSDHKLNFVHILF